MFVGKDPSQDIVFEMTNIVISTIAAPLASSPVGFLDRFVSECTPHNADSVQCKLRTMQTPHKPHRTLMRLAVSVGLCSGVLAALWDLQAHLKFTPEVYTGLSGAFCCSCAR